MKLKFVNYLMLAQSNLIRIYIHLNLNLKLNLNDYNINSMLIDKFIYIHTIDQTKV